jgi:ABC-2 type transport system ATP-binding protein
LREEQKKTVLLSSHQLSEIEIIANRMVIINQGKTIVEGEVHELLEKQSLNLEVTVENTPKFEEMMQQYYPNLVTRLLYKSTYHIEMLEDVRLEMIQRMVESGCGLKSVIPKRSLEDFFIKMTEK